MAGKDLLKAIKRFGNDFERNLKKQAPYRTGRLKDSLKTFADIQRETVRTGVEMVYYGEFVNSGTYKMEANPFIERAWEETKLDSDVEAALLDEVADMFDKTFE